jgi:hypothetical protein
MVGNLLKSSETVSLSKKLCFLEFIVVLHFAHRSNFVQIANLGACCEAHFSLYLLPKSKTFVVTLGQKV